LSLTSFLPEACELLGVALDDLEMPAVGAQNRQEIGKRCLPRRARELDLHESSMVP
jgi:hypothetical protein